MAAPQAQAGGGRPRRHPPAVDRLGNDAVSLLGAGTRDTPNRNMQIAPDQIDPDAAKVVQRLRRFDHAAYLVGGGVRDLLLGRKPKDFDVVTSATPPEKRDGSSSDS